MITFDWTISLGTIITVATQVAIAGAVVFRWGRRMYQRVMLADSFAARMEAVEAGLSTLTDTVAANMLSTERMHEHNDWRLATIERRVGIAYPPRPS